jgi:hypothetical protein
MWQILFPHFHISPRVPVNITLLPHLRCSMFAGTHGEMWKCGKIILAIPLRLADLRPPPKNYLYGVGLVLKISSKSIIRSKVIQLFILDRQTYRCRFYTGTQTDACPPINIQMGDIFNALFDNFHFTTFALLTPFVKDKI